MPQRPACFECGSASSHDHHVVAKSQGGTQTVPLCLRCHGKAHHSKMPSTALIKAGIARARKKGIRWGRPRSPHADKILILLEKGIHPIKISKRLKVPVSTVYSIKRRKNKA